MYQEFTYPVQKLYTQHLVDKHQLTNCKVNIEDQLNHIVVNIFKDFAVGSQIRTEQNYRVNITHAASIPKTAVDWVKKLIVDFCPELQFGWLKPEYKQITKQEKVYTTNTYYNVYPVPEQWDRNQYRIRYLESQPYTVSEWNSAVGRVMPLTPITRYNGKELTDYMAKYLYDKNYFTSTNK